jgi:ATP-dependent Clp protease protease subunit
MYAKSNAPSIQHLTDLLSKGIDVKNRIVYLTGEIGLETVSYFRTSIETIYQVSEDSVTPVTININSPGGCTFSMFGVVDAFASFSSPINTCCNGTAMSAAAIILASGSGIRSITPNSTVMVHRSSSAFDLNDLPPKERVSSHQKLDQILNNRLFEVLARKSNRDVKFWEAKTKADFFMSPEQALEFGIVDRIAL